MGDVISIDQQPEQLGSPKEVAKFLGVSEQFVRDHREEIPGALRVGCGARQLWRFDMAKVRAWQQQQEQERKRA